MYPEGVLAGLSPLHCNAMHQLLSIPGLTRLHGESRFRFWQKDRKNYECEHPLDRKTRKPTACPVAQQLDQLCGVYKRHAINPP